MFCILIIASDVKKAKALILNNICYFKNKST